VFRTKSLETLSDYSSIALLAPEVMRAASFGVFRTINIVD
jgi:hypothetical protein